MSAQDNMNPQQFSTWYHGTSSEAADSIQREGLTAESYGKGNMTLASDRGKAGMFGMLRAGMSNTSVVTLRIPHNKLDEYTVSASTPGVRGLNKPLPPSMVHSVDRF